MLCLIKQQLLFCKCFRAKVSKKIDIKKLAIPSIDIETRMMHTRGVQAKPIEKQKLGLK
jgi:hypothetical protein